MSHRKTRAEKSIATVGLRFVGCFGKHSRLIGFIQDQFSIPGIKVFLDGVSRMPPLFVSDKTLFDLVEVVDVHEQRDAIE